VKRIKKTAQRTGLLIVALLAVAAGIFLFTRPMLAPGSDSSFSNSQLNNSSSLGETYSLGDSNELVGEKVKADSYLVFDETSGKVIASRKPNTPVAIASITKLMTALVTEKYGDLNASWAINSASTSEIRPILGLTVGDKVLVSDLVNAMLVGSANDAAAALGEYISSVTDKPMIETMNAEAKSLGMTSTHYENPIGWDSEQNYSTADDLKLLLDTIRPMTMFSDLDRKQSYSFTSELGKAYTVKATNTLLSTDPDIHAIKTGYTDEAKGAMITAIHHGDVKFVIIVLGSPDRENDTLLLKSQVLKILAP
jgi:serine-type D-Ala-D-Ala carboxypeptidase (penicillin-binding protein 5/6)